MSVTTIQLQSEIKERLDELKRHPRESYNDVIRRLVDSWVDDESLSDEEIRGIEEALDDIRKGRVHTEEKVRKEFGIE